MKKSNIASLALGSLFAAAAFSPLAQAADNPFAAKPMAGGYQLAQADMAADAAGKKADGTCGAGKTISEKKKEGKCAASKESRKQAAKKTDGSCGASKKADGSCGASKAAPAEGMGMDKKTDGKCGEAKCGASKR